MLRIITISGLDGSGKSTQIELLKNYLEAQGSRVFYFHAVSFSLANIFSAKDQTRKMTRSVTKASCLTIWLRKMFLKIDLLRFKKLRAKLEKQGYSHIISDRYFYDSIINITYLLGGEASKLVKYSIIKPDIAVYLKVDPEIIMQRERKPDQGIEYLKNKNGIYSNFSNNWNLLVIDGNRPKEAIFEEIKRLCQNNI
jgi:dTMP kinase